MEGHRCTQEHEGSATDVGDLLGIETELCRSFGLGFHSQTAALGHLGFHP